MESAPLEVELKLEVMPKSLDRLRRHPAFAGQDGNAGAAQKLVSMYYDTPDFLLRRKGLSLRLRMNGKGQKRRRILPGEILRAPKQRHAKQRPATAPMLSMAR